MYFSVSDSDASDNGTAATSLPPADGGSETFVCSSAGRFPDVKECNLFHICINAFIRYIDVPIRCPGNSLYDPYMKRCTNQPVQCPGERYLVCFTPGIFPHPDDCSKYYKCTWRSLYKNFDLIQYSCPPDYAYSASKKKCVKSDNCQSSQDLKPFTCTEAGRFAAESNCKDYYECRPRGDELILSIKTCPFMKTFDRESKRCRDYFLVNCPFDDYDDSNESVESDYAYED